MDRHSVMGLTLCALLAATAPITAHHGAAAYDLAETRALEAIVTEFKWINPHGLIEFDVRNSAGELQHWTAETAGLAILVRAGWSKTAIQSGARITVSGHPARNGGTTMILERIVLADGRVLNNFVPR